MLDRIKNLSAYQILAYRYQKQAPDRTTMVGDVSSSDCTIKRIEDWERDHARTDGRDYYLCPDRLSGSDYSGTGIIGRANFRAFQKLFEHYHKLSGNHNNFGIAISINWLLRASDEALKVMDLLEALEDYPIICDETLSEVECELAEEAWENWTHDDYRAGLEERFDTKIKKDLRELFQKVLERESIYWAISGNDMTIDMDKMIAKTKLEELS